MKKLTLILAIALLILTTSCAAPAEASTEILTITSYDGYAFDGRLTLPAGAYNVSKLLIHINGSGPNTYIGNKPADTNSNKRYNYYDFYAEELSARGVASFSYNTRGVDVNRFVNTEEYQSYLPLNTVEDVHAMITTLKQNPRLKNSKVILLGFSEGSTIAPLVAEKYPDEVDVLFLEGYANTTVYDIFEWQITGRNAWDLGFATVFELDEAGRVSRAVYEADADRADNPFTTAGIPFESFDLDGDGFIDETDMRSLAETVQGYTFDDWQAAVEAGDDLWLKWNNKDHPITSAWWKQHASLRDNGEVLAGLDLPIYIFHGTLDARTPVTGVYDVQESFKELGKSNLVVSVFEGHSHDLNFDDVILERGIPEGIAQLLTAVNNC